LCVQPQVAVTPPEGKGVKISEFGRQLGQRLPQGRQVEAAVRLRLRDVRRALQRQHLAGVRLTEQKHQMKWHLLGKANVGSLPRLTRRGTTERRLRWLADSTRPCCSAPTGGHVTSQVRIAEVADAALVARLLDDFNREFRTATPGIGVLKGRLQRLLGQSDVVAVLADDPAVGLAVLTLRPNVWYDGPVALLDELYVVPEWRGQGIGSVLLEAAEQFTRGRGGELLEINVDGEDVGARRFYERHGYRNSEPGSDEQLLYYFRELPTCDWSRPSCVARRIGLSSLRG